MSADFIAKCPLRGKYLAVENHYIRNSYFRLSYHVAWGDSPSNSIFYFLPFRGIMDNELEKFYTGGRVQTDATAVILEIKDED